jgi:hypothetical protein
VSLISAPFIPVLNPVLPRSSTVLTEGGNSLAWAEMYYCIGLSFRFFEWELHETTLRNVTFTRDYFVSHPEQDTKGVRMKIVKELE